MENEKGFNRRRFLTVAALGVGASQLSAINLLKAGPLDRVDEQANTVQVRILLTPSNR
jgi:hypothetical protein